MIYRWWIPAIIAVVLRVIYWFHASDEAWFLAPGTDPEYYLTWARAIVSGSATEMGFVPYPRAPLYPLILSYILRIFGDGWIWIRLFNLFCDIITTGLILHLGRAADGAKVGFLAAMLFALSGAAIYFTGEILMTSLATVSATAFVVLFVSALQNPDKRFPLLSGLAVGWTSLLRPNMPVVLPFSIAALFLAEGKRKINLKSRSFHAVLHLTAAIVVIAPTTLANWSGTGDFIPISTQGGVNFYIGNARGASGWASVLPGYGAAWSEQDAQAAVMQDAGNDRIGRGGFPGHFWKMGLKEIVADPIDWFGLMIKKVHLLAGAREIGNNRPLSLATDAFPPLVLLLQLSLGALAPFALIGAWTHRNSIEVITIISFAAVYGFSILVFFITSRYRMPLLPTVTVLAALGIKAVWTELTSRRITTMIIMLFIGGTVLAYPNWYGEQFEQRVQAEFVAGNAHLRLGQTVQAIERFRRATTLEPSFPEAHLNLGVALLRSGDTTGAAAQFRRELRYFPNSANAMNNLGTISETKGDLENAQQLYESALEAKAHHLDARRNLVGIFLKKGDRSVLEGKLDQAEDYYEQASYRNPADPRPFHRLAMIAAQEGKIGTAKRLLQEALVRDGGYTPAIHALEALDRVN